MRSPAAALPEPVGDGQQRDDRGERHERQDAALFALALAGAGIVIDPSLLSAALQRPVGVSEYVKLAWLASSLATVAGALGAGLESDAAVREVAYGYRPERETELDSALPAAPE